MADALVSSKLIDPTVDDEALGTTLAQKGQLSCALVVLYRAAIKASKPTDTAQAKYALVAYDCGLCNHALSVLADWTRAQPTSVPLLLTYARLLTRAVADDYRAPSALEDALQFARQAVEQSKGDERAKLTTAMVLARLGRYTNARSELYSVSTSDAVTLERAMELFEARDDGRIASADIARCVTRWGAADAQLSDPDRTDLAKSLQRLLRLFNEYEIARQLLTAWSENAPRNPLVAVGFSQLAQWVAVAPHTAETSDSSKRTELLKDAVHYAEHAVELLSGDSYAQHRALVTWAVAVAHAMDGKWEEALSEFEAVAEALREKADPDSDARFNLAVAHAHDRRADHASELFFAYLEDFPDDVYARSECAVALALKGDNDQRAREQLDIVLQRMPELTEARINRGIILRRLAFFDLAQDDFDRAKSALRPDDEDLEFDVALTFEAKNQAKLSEPKVLEQAVALYRRVTDREGPLDKPLHANAWIHLGVLLMRDKAKIRESIECFDRVVSLSPSDLGPARELARSLKALALWTQDPADKARVADVLDRAQQPTEPGPPALARTAALVRAGRYNDALRVLDLFESGDDAPPLVPFFRATVYGLLRRPRQAAEQFERFFALAAKLIDSKTKSIDPEVLAVAHFRRGLMHFDTQNYDAALAELGLACESDALPEEGRAEAKLTMARTLVCLERYADAHDLAEDLTNRNEKAYERWEVLGQATVRLGESLRDDDIVDDGISHLRKARKLISRRGDNGQCAAQARIAFLIGYAHAVRREFQQAAQAMSEARALARALPKEKRPFNPLHAEANLRRIKRGNSAPFDVPTYVKFGMTLLCLVFLIASYVQVPCMAGMPCLAFVRPDGTALATLTVITLLLIPTLFLLPALSKIRFGEVELQRVDAVPTNWVAMTASLQQTLIEARLDGAAWQRGDRRAVEGLSTDAVARAAGTDVWRPLSAAFRSPLTQEHWHKCSIGAFHGRDLFGPLSG